MSAGGDYVDEDGADTSIRSRELVATLGGSVLLAISGAYITVVNTAVGIQTRAISSVGSFLQQFVDVTLGDSAATVVSGWEVAATTALEAEVFAPWILTIEAIVIAAIVAALWDRRPYA